MRQVADLDPEVFKRLLVSTCEEIADSPDGAVAVIGSATVCEALQRSLEPLGLDRAVGHTIETDQPDWQRNLRILRSESIQVVVLAVDAEKECLLRLIAAHSPHRPRVVLAGYRQFEFRDPIYSAALEDLDEPSLANGYPNSRVHLFECLRNAARRQLDGVVVEFGMFRGGTTQFLCEAIRRLGQRWPVIGFDSFNGFPPRTHLFDLYDHPDLYDISYEEVVRRFEGRNVEIVAGDVRVTAPKALAGRPILVAFVDTDNYTSGSAAIRSVRDQVVPGGAIVLDHYTGVDRFVRTIGERMAAQELLADDPRFFNLHGTGVFLRQC